MKIKTSELTGAALDWAVAKCEGISTAEFITLHSLPASDAAWKYQYSTDWAQGGPIIEREKIATQFWVSEGEWEALIKGGFFACTGPTPLIAAMRCYVASKLGDEVDVPEELCK